MRSRAPSACGGTAGTGITVRRDSGEGSSSIGLTSNAQGWRARSGRVLGGLRSEASRLNWLSPRLLAHSLVSLLDAPGSHNEPAAATSTGSPATCHDGPSP